MITKITCYFSEKSQHKSDTCVLQFGGFHFENILFLIIGVPTFFFFSSSDTHPIVFTVLLCVCGRWQKKNKREFWIEKKRTTVLYIYLRSQICAWEKGRITKQRKPTTFYLKKKREKAWYALWNTYYATYELILIFTFIELGIFLLGHLLFVGKAKIMRWIYHFNIRGKNMEKKVIWFSFPS